MAAKPKPKRQRKKPTKPSESELKPHKIVGQLIGARFNEHGDIVGEEMMGEVQIFRANFSKVEQTIDNAVKEARAQGLMA